MEVDPGKHVEIRARFIGTTIIIHLVGNHLTFAIRMPQEIVDGLASNKQLCVIGCPTHDRIELPPTAAAPVTDRKTLSKRDGQVPSKRAKDHSFKMPGRGRVYTEEEARLKCKQVLLNVYETEDDVATPTAAESVSLNSEKKRRRNKSGDDRDPSSFTFNLLQGNVDRGTAGGRQSRKSRSKNLDTSLIGRQSKAKRRTKRKRGSKNRKHLSKRSVPEDLCNESRLAELHSNFYFESCVFDLLTTSDANFTLAARVALLDLQRTHALHENAPGASLEVVRQWTLSEFRSRTAGCSKQHETQSPPLEDTYEPGPSERDPRTPRGSATTASVSLLLLLISLLISSLDVDLFSCSSRDHRGNKRTFYHNNKIDCITYNNNRAFQKHTSFLIESAPT